jgi:hypothetical protein
MYLRNLVVNNRWLAVGFHSNLSMTSITQQIFQISNSLFQVCDKGTMML